MLINHSVKNFAQSEDGVATIELAAVVGVLGALAVGMFEFASAIHQHIQLQQAARAGVEFAMKYPSDTAGIEQAVIGATGNSSPGLSVAVAQFCECPDGTSIACTDTCAASVLPNTFIQVALTQPALGLLSESGLLPGITLEAAATMRVR
jgi:Flp pilus assembly protein TadG